MSLPPGRLTRSGSGSGPNASLAAESKSVVECSHPFPSVVIAPAAAAAAVVQVPADAAADSAPCPTLKLLPSLRQAGPHSNKCTRVLERASWVPAGCSWVPASCTGCKRWYLHAIVPGDVLVALWVAACAWTLTKHERLVSVVRQGHWPTQARLQCADRA